MIRWLDSISHDAREIYLLGDIFDHWFEYSTVVPKGFIRFLSKLAELSDQGIRIHYFMGNHDMWIADYFTEEIGLVIHDAPYLLETAGLKLFLAHGDGLGPGDRIYKITKALFRNRINRFLFGAIHPGLGIRIMQYFSRKSRNRQDKKSTIYSPENDRQIQFCESYLVNEGHIDGFLMGHRHHPIDHLLSNRTSRYINLGDWMRHFTYAVLDGNQLTLHSYQDAVPGD